MTIKNLLENLASGSIKTSDALASAKIIASKQGHEKFLTWLNSELEGYSSNADVPSYRRFQTEIKGDIVDPYGSKNPDVILALDALSEQLGINLNEHQEKQNIFIIESLDEKKGRLIVPFPPGSVRMLNDVVAKNNPGYQLISAYRDTPFNLVSKITGTES